MCGMLAFWFFGFAVFQGVNDKAHVINKARKEMNPERAQIKEKLESPLCIGLIMGLVSFLIQQPQGGGKMKTKFFGLGIALTVPVLF